MVSIVLVFPAYVRAAEDDPAASTSTARSARSSRNRAINATARMSTSARPTSGSIMRDGLFRSADGTTIVVPGKPEESELFARITADDPELRMPPPKSGGAPICPNRST